MPLVLLLIAILPLKQQSFWTGSGGAFTASKYLGAVCVLYAAAYVAMSGRIPGYLATWQARWYLLFVLVIYVSSAQPGSALSTFNPLLGPTSLFLLYLILLSVVDSIKRLRWVLLTVIGSVGWGSLYVLREWQTARGWATGYRAGFVVGDGNHFGVSAICGIALAWYLAQDRRSGWKRWFCWVCMLLALVATILAGASRGGLLGLAAAFLFVMVRSRRRRLRVVSTLVLLVVLNLAYPHSPFRRLLHPDVNDQGSADAHRASWEAGLRMVREHPIAGIGIGAFKSQMDHYRPNWYGGPPFMAHNAYISVAAEMGIPGLLLFLSVLIASYMSLERVYRNRLAQPLITRTAIALQAALVGNAVSIFFISAEHHEHLWLTVFISMCLPPLASRVVRTHAKTLGSLDSAMSPSAAVTPLSQVLAFTGL